MAIKKIPVPFCDVCGLPFLPRPKLSDGTPNPVFADPRKAKNCGKCKSVMWNSGGVDKRRKKPVESPVEVELVVVPIADWGGKDEDDPGNAQDFAVIEQTIDTFTYPGTMTVTPEIQAKMDEVGFPKSFGQVSRCNHGLYSCPQCHPEIAA